LRGRKIEDSRFPTLITGLCAHKGILVESKHKIRNSIDKKFINHHCTNPKENPEQRNRAPSPPFSPSSPTLEDVKKKIMRHLMHVEEQQSSLCRFMMHLYRGLHDRINPESFMNPDELSSYINWPGDRPSSVGEETDNAEVQSTTGNVRKPTAKEKAEAATTEAANVGAAAEETEIEQSPGF